MPRLYTVTSGSFYPKHAGRVIADSNILSPALRYMIGARNSAPHDEDLAGLRWLQSYRLSHRVQGRTGGSSNSQHLDFRHALIELSRDNGNVDMDRFCRFIECAELLYDWVDEIGSLQPKIARYRSPRRPKTRYSIEATNIDERDHSHATVALLEIYKLDRARTAGRFASPSAALDALSEWEGAIWRSGMLTAEVTHAAIYAALGGDSAPLLAICKFPQYKSRRHALSHAWNAAWDFHFLHMIRFSSVGLREYEGTPARTVLLTFDRALATAAETITPLAGTIGGVTGAVTRIDNQWLRRNVRDDEGAMERLAAWKFRITARQRERVTSGTSSLWTSDEAKARRDELLDELFPAEEGQQRDGSGGD